ncbi:MAG: bifunctional phosphopantothenoylcysteine decarboxylase/phosphopantothenate--cysteine ligase CoaBC [Saprospiraceae bacterium]|nr:bifunctional phosphopantothenoylcysteine decarboxylase/phosphopantothenate--cysteine ligase CoaBC [Saprospiraceae bacterium]
MFTNLRNKKIIVGVCGSIAAYKTVFLCRLLISEGAEVKVVITESAATFVTPLTFSTLSKNPVYHQWSDANQWNNHVELGLWADLMVIAPVTASTMSKMASGKVDNMLLAVYLSAKCPVFFAPAMDLDMWQHPSTKKNVALLQSYGNHLIPVGKGELASGLSGEGRMAEPEFILGFIQNYFSAKQKLQGKKVLITAGPTHEQIDPVRFIGNASSGKMGIAIADVFAAAGAEVTLVLGPSMIQPKEKSINVISVNSSDDMFFACESVFKDSDITIFAAAVADYKPKTISDQKIKKQNPEFLLELVKTIDIASELGKRKRENQITVGFALETNDELENAQKKLQKKQFDLLVLNSLNDTGAGFQTDTNKVTILDKDGDIREYPLKPKSEVAMDILDMVCQKLKSQ